MANFSNLITTKKGHELIVKILAGEIAIEPQSPFTRIVTSSAVYEISQLEGLTTLDQIKQETLVSAVTKQNKTTVLIHGGIENSRLTVGYRLNAVGVFYKEPNDPQEYLFGAAIHKPTVEEPNADFIFPFNGLTATGLLFDLLASVGNADNISFNVDPAAIVTVKTLLLHDTNDTAHENRFRRLQAQIDEIDHENQSTALKNHISTPITSPTGVHGIRYHNNQLQIWDTEKWITINTGGTGGGETTPPITLPELDKETLTLPDTRERQGIITDDNGCIWLGGGVTRGISGGTASDRVDRYTPDGIRQTMPSMSVARATDISTAKDKDGNLWFIGGAGRTAAGGGKVIDRYTPAGVKSTLAAPEVFSEGGVTTDGNGDVWHMGGYSEFIQSGSVGHILKKAYRCTSDGVWVTMPQLSWERLLIAAAKDGNGNVWAFGGQANAGGEFQVTNGMTPIVDRYTPDGIHTVMTQMSAIKHRSVTITDDKGNMWVGGGSILPLYTTGSNSDRNEALNAIYRNFAVVNRYSPDGTRTVMPPLSFNPVPSPDGMLAFNGCAAATDSDGNPLFGYHYDSGTGFYDTYIIDRYTKDGAQTTIVLPDITHPTPSLDGWPVETCAATDGDGNPWFVLAGQAAVFKTR